MSTAAVMDTLHHPSPAAATMIAAEHDLGTGAAPNSIRSAAVAGPVGGIPSTVQDALTHLSVASAATAKCPLAARWSFSFCHRPPGVKGSASNYADQMKIIGSVDTLQSFWAMYAHLKRPSELPIISDYHFFRDAIKPVWEDAGNADGGKWIVRIKKGLADRYWENLVLALISDEFRVGAQICGAVLSLRSGEDIISVWNKSADGVRINLKIRDALKRVLNLPADTIMEYKAHKDALVDNSSFRNTDVFR